ncbi:hypothetical protein DXG01_016032 [Tephrocybe rancida]|nr:hypothetical protein DXG01_016032 [Tephrocybe rancida]
MQFAFILSLFMTVSAVVAAPSGHVFMRASCQIGACVAALAPTVVSCVSAAGQNGANALLDAACLAGAVNAAIALPASCDTCLDQIGSDIKGTVNAAVSTVGDAVGDVEGVVGGVAGEIENAIGKIGGEIGF